MPNNTTHHANSAINQKTGGATNNSDTKKAASQNLRLRDLFFLRAEGWLAAWGVGLIALIATVGLLSVSGWFITAAGIAGIITTTAAATGAISFDFLRPAALIRTFAIARTAGRYGERLASHHAVLGLLKDLRLRFFARIAAQKQGTLSHITSSAEVMQRLTSDIDQLDELPLRFWAPWIWALALQFVVIGFLTLVAPKLMWLTLPPLLLAGTIIPALAVRLGISLGKTQTELKQARRSQLLEPLTAMTQLVLWQRWQPFQDAFTSTDSQYQALEERIERIKFMLMAAQQLLLAVVVGLLMWFGFELLATDSLSVPMLAALVLTIFGLYEILLPLGASFTALGLGIAARDRLNTITDTQTTQQYAAQQNTLPQKNIALTVSGASGKWPHALKGFDDVSFTLHAGQALMVTGRSGAGKSTLLAALAGELDISTGKILLNDKPLEQWQLEGEVGYLAQQLDIFDMTLAQNLRLGDVSASDDALWQVLEKVALADWARSQPLGLDTPLGEYGAAISGGQARRVALARLLLQPKAILLLDEPFAGLDATSGAVVLNNLRTQQKSGLLIMVTHQAQVPEDVQRLEVV